MSDDSDSESDYSGFQEDESPYAQTGGGADEAPDPANSEYIDVADGEPDPTTKVYEENDIDDEEFGFGVDEPGVTAMYDGSEPGGGEAAGPRGSEIAIAKASKAGSLAKGTVIPP